MELKDGIEKWRINSQKSFRFYRNWLFISAGLALAGIIEMKLRTTFDIYEVLVFILTLLFFSYAIYFSARCISAKLTISRGPYYELGQIVELKENRFVAIRFYDETTKRTAIGVFELVGGEKISGKPKFREVNLYSNQKENDSSIMKKIAKLYEVTDGDLGEFHLDWI